MKDLDLDKVLESLVGQVIEKVNIEGISPGTHYMNIRTNKCEVRLSIDNLYCQVDKYEKE